MSKVLTDTELLDLIESESLDLRCHSVPLADTGDYDIAWTVTEHHQGKPRERIIGNGQTAREALIDSQRKPCQPCDGEGITTPDGDDTEPQICTACHGRGKV